MKRALSFIIPFVIIGGSIVVGARIIVAGKPDVVLYVPAPAAVVVDQPATVTETAPAARVPVRMWGAGDSSFEWGLAAAMITIDDARPGIVYDSDTERANRDSYAELGCPLVNDDMLQQHANGEAHGYGWNGVGNPGIACDWRKPATEQDVVIASFGPTSMYDRKPEAGGPTTNLLDPVFAARIEQRMDDFEAFAGVPVLWVNWYDDPSPDEQEAAFTALIQTRGCWFDIGTLDLQSADYADGIHLSPQGSLTVAAALSDAATRCAL